MPSVPVLRVCASASRSAGHVLQVVFLRLRRANPALLVVFFSALVMFLRALSGAGYVDPQSYAPPPPPNIAYNQTYAPLDGPMKPSVYTSFTEHWARFKEAFLSCPAEMTDDTGLLGGVADEPGVNAKSDGTSRAGAEEPQARTRQRTGVICLKERLSGAIDLRGAGGPSIRKEERAFGPSLNGIPFGRKDRSAIEQEESTI